MPLIVFDTGTRPEYAQDVHNVVALPVGTTVRYEYRQGLITTDAVEVFADVNSLVPVILAYAQYTDYARGDADQGGAPIPRPTLYLALTRIATLAYVSLSGDKWHLDLTLGGYPDPDIDPYELCQPLIDFGEIPFSKWISTIEGLDVGGLVSKDEGVGWQSVCTALSTPPSQFATDCFWRLLAVKAEGKVVNASVGESRDRSPGIVVGRWHVKEDSDLRLKIQATRPAHDRVRAGCDVELGAESGVPFQIPTGKVNLRGYAETDIGVETRHLGIKGSEGLLEMRTTSEGHEWPVGPHLLLPIYVTKRLSWVYVGIIMLAMAVSLGLLAKGLFDADQAMFGALAVLGASICGVAGAALLTGTVTVFK